MRKLVGDVWTLRLLGLCAGLAFLLLINTLWQPRAHLPQIAEAVPAAVQSETSPADPGAPDPEIAAALDVEALPARKVEPLPAYGVTLQRPLFLATRRPAPVAPVQAAPPPKPAAPPRSNLSGMRLTGVIMTADKALGLLSIPGQSELMRAREGQVVNGWKVTAVEEDALVLNNGEEDFRMALWEEKPGQGAVPAMQTTGNAQPPGHPRTVAGGRQ